MKEVCDAIDSYNKYRARIAAGLLNAVTTTGGLSAGIRLTDSQIKLPFISEDFVSRYEEKQTLVEKYAEIYGDNPITSADIFRHRDLLELMELMEVGAHETIHSIQKHSYRSVFTLVDALQQIESWEVLLFFSHAGEGGQWKMGKSFLDCLHHLNDPYLQENIASNIREACNIVLTATSPRSCGLGLQHLIEGQAFVASRLSIRAFDALPMEVPELYTAAWNTFKEAGGSNPLVFVLMAGAALRYGDISTDDERSSFNDFYPHPVDIFTYLLHFVTEIEEVLDPTDSIAVPFGISLFGNSGLEGTPYNQPKFRKLVRTVNAKQVLPRDSSDPTLSYLQSTASNDDFDNDEERKEFERKRQQAIFYPFDPCQNSFDLVNDDSKVLESLLETSKAIAVIINTVYSRVATPMKNQFRDVDNSNIANAVGMEVANRFPDYYKEEILLRVLIDNGGGLTGQLFNFFLTDIKSIVKVKPFEHAPEITHIEYLSMCLMPDMIKGLLDIFLWRSEKLPEGVSPQLPYCCKKHGIVQVEHATPTFFDSCPYEDAVGRAFQIMFRRSINSFLQ